MIYESDGEILFDSEKESSKGDVVIYENKSYLISSVARSFSRSGRHVMCDTTVALMKVVINDISDINGEVIK